MVFIGIYPGLLFSGMIHQQILQFGVLCELKAVLNVFLPARRRPSGLVVSGVCLCVCVCVRTVFVRKISQERVHESPPNSVGGSRG